MSSISSFPCWGSSSAVARKLTITLVTLLGVVEYISMKSFFFVLKGDEYTFSIVVVRRVILSQIALMERVKFV